MSVARGFLSGAKASEVPCRAGPTGEPAGVLLAVPSEHCDGLTVSHGTTWGHLEGDTLKILVF